MRKGSADSGNVWAMVFAGGEFRNDTAILAVNVDLGSDDAGEDFAAIGNDSRGGFVAGRFDAEDANAHESMLTQRFLAVRGGRKFPRPTPPTQKQFKKRNSLSRFLSRPNQKRDVHRRAQKSE